MSNDFYGDEVLSGKTPVHRVVETANVLAFHHTRPSYPVHIVVIPKQHIPSLLDLDTTDSHLVIELIKVIQQIAAQVVENHQSCRVVTNLGNYQDSKHLHWHIISGKLVEDS